MGNKSSKPKKADKKEEKNKSTMEFKQSFSKTTSTSSSSATTYIRNEQTFHNKVLNSGSFRSTSITSPMSLNSNVQNRFDHKSEIWNPSESLPKRISGFSRYDERIISPNMIQNLPTINNVQKLKNKPPEKAPVKPKKSPKVSQCNQLSSSDCYHQSYLVTRRPVYIINSYFKGLKEERKGSEKDVERLQKTFKKFTMDCSVIKDPTTKTIKQLANKYKTNNCANYDFLMFVIMTHGYNNGTLTAKDGSYNVNDEFISIIQENDSLQNIPKIFIIQACRGNLQQDAVPVNSSKMKPADTLKIFSTYEGFTSIRDIEKGTIFIQNFCDKLEEFGETEDLESIVKKVTSACLEETKQVPEQSTTLRKRVFIGRIRRI